MVSLNIGAAAEIDIASSSDITNMLDTNTEKLLSRLNGCKKLAKPLGTSAILTLVAGANATLSLGRPSFGRVWVITRSTIVGADDHTSVSGVVAALYNGDDTNPGLVDIVIPGQAVPYWTSNNDEMLMVNSKSNLFWNITNTSMSTIISQQFVASATAWEYREQDLLGQAI
jgi:hypothetical protein